MPRSAEEPKAMANVTINAFGKRLIIRQPWYVFIANCINYNDKNWCSKHFSQMASFCTATSNSAKFKNPKWQITTALEKGTRNPPFYCTDLSYGKSKWPTEKLSRQSSLTFFISWTVLERPRRTENIPCLKETSWINALAESLFLTYYDRHQGVSPLCTINELE